MITRKAATRLRLVSDSNGLAAHLSAVPSRSGDSVGGSPPARLDSIYRALKSHWPEYLMEAFGLGLFMISACAFAILLDHPASPVHQAIPDATLRRVLTGAAMGLTAIANVYSPWGKRSSARAGQPSPTSNRAARRRRTCSTTATCSAPPRPVAATSSSCPSPSRPTGRRSRRRGEDTWEAEMALPGEK